MHTLNNEEVDKNWKQSLQFELCAIFEYLRWYHRNSYITRRGWYCRVME